MTKEPSMDIGKEITNHLEWIETIASLLGSDELTKDDVQAVSRHDKCELGQWLNSEASMEFRNLPEFDKLIQSHDEFHTLAGFLITAYQMGKESEAIETEKKFIEMSKRVINHLHALQEYERAKGGGVAK
jgi:methyl-accepting chemotaxis protein